MKKLLLLLLLIIPFVVSCSKDDDDIPSQRVGFNPVEGVWIEDGKLTSVNGAQYIERIFTPDYQYTVTAYYKDSEPSSVSYKYVVDDNKYYNMNGIAYYYVVSNDTLYIDSSPIVKVRDSRSISVRK